MKLKTIAAATMLGFASLAAQAGSLSSVAGTSYFKITGVTTESNTFAGSNESTWGIGNVSSIQDKNGNNQWSSGEGGQYLTYMIYGIADQSFSSGGLYGTNIFNVGATGGSADGKIHLDVYLNTAPPATVTNALIANRTGFGSYNGITNLPGSSLYLSLAFVPGGVVDDPSTLVNEALATLLQNTTGQSLPATGKGFFYAEVTGGSAANTWNTNAFLGGTADLRGDFTLAPNEADNGQNGLGFAGLVNDPIKGVALPEPGSIALMGLGLAGLASLRRRKV